MGKLWLSKTRILKEVHQKMKNKETGKNFSLKHIFRTADHHSAQNTIPNRTEFEIFLYWVGFIRRLTTTFKKNILHSATEYVILQSATTEERIVKEHKYNFLERRNSTNKQIFDLIVI